MPFHDQEWEDLQRDYHIFPAYTDWIYGPDQRPFSVTQEPGLHPMIYHMGHFPPIRYTNSMPSRSWSSKTAEYPEKSKIAVTQMVLAGQNDTSNSDMSGTNSGRRTPGLDAPSRIGNPLDRLLPPQGVRTVFEKEMARRQTLNKSQSHRRSRAAVLFSPLQQRQSVSSTIQQTQIKDTPLAHRPDVQSQQPSFLRSSSATDIDETPASMNLRQKPDTFSPFASQATMLPPPANLPQQQPQRATGPSNNLPLTAAPDSSPEANQQISLLQPSDILHNARYDSLPSAKRTEIAKILAHRWGVVRGSPPDNPLRAKARSDIRKVTMIVNNSVSNQQIVMDLQKHRAQPLQMQAARERVQMGQIQQIQQHQHMPGTPQVYAQPQLQPGVSSSHPTKSSPTPRTAPQEPYYSITHAPQQMQLPQQSRPQGYQAHYQPHQHTGEQYERSPSQNPRPKPAQLQASAQLCANINRHIPEVWQFLLIAQNTSQPAQYRENANQWMTEFKNSLPVEGRAYLMHVMQRALLEQSQGRDALAFLGPQGRPT